MRSSKMYDLTSKETAATRDGFGDALIALGEKNKDIVALAAGTGDSTRAHRFRERFPKRYIEAGIAEQNMIGMAAGLALAGKIPFASSFAAFVPGRCYDQIRQSVCYSNLNVKLVGTHAGITVGADGATHQMLVDVSILRALPNITIICPADSREAYKATEAAAAMKGPCYLRLSREKLPVFTDEKTPFEIGIAITFREGTDVTLIACGVEVYYSLIAAEALEKEGISARVLNMHTIKPIDKNAIIKAAKETGAIVTAEEHQILGGMGSAVAEVITKNQPVPMRFIGIQDIFGESGKPADLLEKYGLTDKAIADAARDVLKQK